MTNLRFEYAVVGIVEEIELSLELMASVLPLWFKGSSHAYVRS